MRYGVIPPAVITELVKERERLGFDKYLPPGMVSKVAIYYQRTPTQLYAMMRDPGVYQERVKAMGPAERELAIRWARWFLGLPELNEPKVTVLPVVQTSIRPLTKFELMTGRRERRT